MKKLAMLTAVALLMTSCNQPSQPTRTFADEDECEDAGMSDAYCDMLFPEAEDFFKKKPTAKPKAKPKSKLAYRSRTTVKRSK